MNKIKVSVIIPIYNTEQYIEQCICSVLAQKLDDIEIICIDDGSTDCSIDIIRKYASEDNRIIILQKENEGQSIARNAGMDISHGEYIYFLDSDDFISDDALQILYYEASKNNLDNIYFDAESFFESDDLKKQHSSYINYYSRRSNYPEIVSGLELLQQMEQNKDFRVSPCLQFFKKSFLLKNNLRFEENMIHEDDIFSLKVCLYAERSRHIPEKLYMRRIRENSTMTSSNCFQHSYGYLRCMICMLEELPKKEVEETYHTVLLKQLYSLQSRAVKRITSVSNTDLNSFIGQIPFCEEVYYRLLIEKAAMTYREITALKKDTKQLKKRIHDLETSNSFRIGRIITYIPRKIKKLLK